MRAGQKSCDRCGERQDFFITPYWVPDQGWCQQCCFEMAKHYDKEGWPDDDCEMPIPPGALLFRLGMSISAPAIPYDPVVDAEF